MDHRAGLGLSQGASIKESVDMGLREKLHQLITDAMAVWRSEGTNRFLTRRRMTEDELLKEYKASQADGGEKSKPSDQPSGGKEPTG